MANHTFQTEVNQLLQLIIHSLYSHKEIFLRELISNASDALDKLKYLTLTDEKFKSLVYTPEINITLNEKEKILTLSDNGIGMNQDDLASNLGTIARSGTKAFLGNLGAKAKKDSNLIGQFGVGFYSCFMVADKVEVISQKAGETAAFKWTSNGKDGYDLEPSVRDSQGTTIILHINEEGTPYLSKWETESIIKRYSNHIAFPIWLQEIKEKDQQDKAQINEASALWKRSKSELKDEDYTGFYKTIGHDSDEPLAWFHTKAEGTLEYTTLFYIPAKAPFDMFYADYKPGVKLYVKRVFITDDEKELIPSYLRFLRGVIDSEDLPLNVSREILQQNRILANIKSASVKKILSELKDMSEKDKEKYSKFITEYNKPIKEGLYTDYANKETLLELVRFKSTIADGWTSLAEYKDRMKTDQKAIYYITGKDENVLRNSPLLEAYKKNGIEVLIMSDEIDEIVVPMIGKYKDLEIKSVNKSKAGEDLKTEVNKDKEKSAEPVIKKIKDALGDTVKDVVVSARLSDSPSCIVADDDDPTAGMAHILKAMGRNEMADQKFILEINPDHDIVKKLASADDQTVKDVSFLLFEQACMLENVAVKDPNEFVKRLNRVMSKI